MVLVDHNEEDQAVDNIDKADIMEIIDHHKLGTLQTMQPYQFPQSAGWMYRHDHVSDLW